MDQETLDERVAELLEQAQVFRFVVDEGDLAFVPVPVGPDGQVGPGRRAVKATELEVGDVLDGGGFAYSTLIEIRESDVGLELVVDMIPGGPTVVHVGRDQVFGIRGSDSEGLRG